MTHKLNQIYEQFVNQWVALTIDSEVIAAGKSIKEVEKKLKKDKLEADQIRYILPRDQSV